MAVTHTILFSGHMIDGPDPGLQPRFPAENEEKVKEAILAYLKGTSQPVKGIASGACGGDILFLEACLELGIPGEMYLPFVPGVFKQQSVSFAGRQWEMRFDKLLAGLSVHVLGTTGEGNVYQQVNEWMLTEALHNGAEQMMLMVVWDGVRKGRNGGTSRMVEAAEKHNVKIKIINPLF